MAVVPDARQSLHRQLAMLRVNRTIVISALRQLMDLYQQRKLLKVSISVFR